MSMKLPVYHVQQKRVEAMTYAIQVSIPTHLLLLLLAGVIMLAFLMLFVYILDFLSAVVLYRHYRRRYPMQDRGKIWRHVR